MNNASDQPVAFVTGAAQGLGLGISKHLLDAGWRVTLFDQDADAGQEAFDGLSPARQDRALFIAGDVANEADVKLAIQQTVDRFGRIDGLVNNAGITRDQLAMRLKDEDWQAVLDVNLTSAFKLARNSLRGMMKRRHGRIINITSIVGVTGNPGQTNYAAAKAGMIGWSKSLAQEVAARGITVNCVAPGFITTAMTEELGDAQKEKLLGGIPAGRMGDSKEIAAAVLYLASDEAAYVTGQTLHVNGGMAMI